MSEKTNLIDQPWKIDASEIENSLETDIKSGLPTQEAKSRLDTYGTNQLREAKKKSTWVILADQFKSLLVLLLAVAAVVSFIFGDNVEGIAITAVILINALIGFFTELKAVRSMEALQDLGKVEATAIREGQRITIPAEEIVPGDVLYLTAGSIISADCRLAEVSKLQTDESALTGESVPVGKRTEPIDSDTPLAERINMAFKGTSVTRGEGKGIVVSTGMDTELGHISSLVEEAEDEVTPLEKRLDQLGQKLVWATLGIAAVVGVAGFIAGKEIVLMIETAIALAVATVPEGLPIVATIALARGMRRMAKRHALINHLAAVETLGATNVICTDKTGTLTENQMTVVEINTGEHDIEISGEGLKLEGEFRSSKGKIDPEDVDVLRKLLRTMVLCNNANLQIEREGNEIDPAGDPLEIALLVAGEKAKLQQPNLINKYPEVREVAFDPEVRMMATFNQVNGKNIVNVKGAPEAVLESSSRLETGSGTQKIGGDQIKTWQQKNNEMASDGLRVLAIAYKETEDLDEEPYQDLIFLGLVGLLDPPREEVSGAIQACHQAGIKVVMVTGDQPDTAKKVGQAVGMTEQDDPEILSGRAFEEKDSKDELINAQIIARVNPAQKLDLVTSYQEQGNIVAMTGDGVNDAPALKKADIGIAMGERGTQVAKEAADMVLQDDAFSTIVEAVRQGRAIFDNIRKFVLYLLSCNVSEIAVISLASIINTPLPIKPMQILFLNLVTDVFPALALGVSEGDPNIMDRNPRDPEEPVMRRDHWASIIGYSSLITVVVLAAFGLSFVWLGKETQAAVTISFLTLAFAQLWHVFNMRSHKSHPFKNEVFQNRYVWGALGLCSLLLVAAIYIPGLANILKVTHPGFDGWALVIGMSLLPLIVGQILKGVDLPDLEFIQKLLSSE